MPKKIEVHPELCCGCLLYTLICSAFHYDAFWPSNYLLLQKEPLTRYLIARGWDPDISFPCAENLKELGLLQEEGRIRNAALRG